MERPIFLPRMVFCLTFVLLLASCLDRQFIKGKAEIISVLDTTLNDSSIFAGYVYEHPDYYQNNFPIQNAQIWIDNPDLSTASNALGYYYIKTLPGTYTLKCQKEYNHWPQLIEEAKNVRINKNERIQINFYLGYTVE
ncbi:MAG: carboxypeptidase-like regulatory domain-containing protein [Breznakibacter sp.]